MDDIHQQAHLDQTSPSSHLAALIRTIVDLSSYDSEDDRVIGRAPEFITADKVCNYREHAHGVLVSPPHSTRVYREPAVQQSFMLLLMLVALGELFSSPAIALADGYTLTVLADRPKEVRLGPSRPRHARQLGGVYSIFTIFEVLMSIRSPLFKYTQTASLDLSDDTPRASRPHAHASPLNCSSARHASTAASAGRRRCS